MSRRKFTRDGLLAVVASFYGSKHDSAEAREVQAAKRLENLWVSIADIEMKLGPGGSFAKKLESADTPPEQVAWIFDYLQTVQERMELVAAFPEHPGIDPRARRRGSAPLAHLHGVQPKNFTERKKGPDGREMTRRGTGYYITFGGTDNFFVTNWHCVEGTKEESQYKSLGEHGDDLAVRYEPEYRGPALMMNRELIDLDLQGRMIMMRSLDRFGKDVWRSSFLIKINPALYEKIYKRKPRAGQSKDDRFSSGFIFIMRSGDSTSDEHGAVPPEGQSGTPVLAWMGTPEEGGYQAATTFFGMRKSGIDCVDSEEGLCAPIGHVSGIDALKALCDSAKDARETETNPRGGGFVTRVIRN